MATRQPETIGAGFAIPTRGRRRDVRLCSNHREGLSFDLMKESPETSDVLATAWRAWLGSELPNDKAMANRIVEVTQGLCGASIEETCAFSSGRARTTSTSRGA